MNRPSPSLSDLLNAAERGDLRSTPHPALGPTTPPGVAAELPPNAPTHPAPAQSETVRRALSYSSPPMTRYLLCQALELELADDLDDLAPSPRPRSHLTLLPPPPAAADEGHPSTLSTLSIALLQALDRLEGPSDNDDDLDGPTLTPEFDDTAEDLPESERPTRRYTVPGVPPHMRATKPAIA
ncbi:MAG TPA: hypothetical protein VFS43_44425 [Polyangiaceae bacterium]|nr:hypothetical protein [Polyangiaceae bacterium]